MAEEYKTIQGDTFESIAWRRMGSSSYMMELIEANPEHMETAIFESGITLRIPSVETKADESLTPPWRRRR